jgi:hypothetical protein
MNAIGEGAEDGISVFNKDDLDDDWADGVPVASSDGRFDGVVDGKIEGRAFKCMNRLWLSSLEVQTVGNSERMFDGLSDSIMDGALVSTIGIFSELSNTLGATDGIIDVVDSEGRAEGRVDDLIDDCSWLSEALSDGIVEG